MKKQRGYYTVEAIIVMSTIIIIIFAIISAFLLLYQNAVMFYVATQAAQEGAVMWSDNAHDLEGHMTGTDSQGLYYRIPELFNGGGVEEKKKKIETWAKSELDSMTPDTLIGRGSETVEVNFHNYLVQRIVEVKITKEIDIPFQEIAQYFDADLDIHVTARASVSDPAEYIRNIDYGLELAGELWDMVSDKLDGFLNKKR